MKSPGVTAAGLVLAAGIVSGCSGSDQPAIVSSGPATASADDQRLPQSDALTAAETAQVNRTNAEPAPTPRPDL